MYRSNKNKIFTGANKKKSLYDLDIPENWNQKLIIFIHGYMGYKDWGCWNLVSDYFTFNHLLDLFLDHFLDHFFDHFLDRRPDGKAERPDTVAETSSFLAISMITILVKKCQERESAGNAKGLGPPKG